MKYDDNNNSTDYVCLIVCSYFAGLACFLGEAGGGGGGLSAVH